MDRGVPYLERGTRDLTAFFTPAGGANKEKVAGSLESKP
jgi:hypothetical protein